jgi:hypothetical protein
VTVAQVEAWVGTRKGSIHEAGRTIDAALADAALGRMMLHRRRAATATVLCEFFNRLGSRFSPSAENCAPGAPRDPAGERAIAVTAGELVVSLCGVPPPLAFERAMLAEEEGRFDDARSDLDDVVAAYPGFVAAAVAAARLALASGDPAAALRALAPVEGEITHTRDGAALLADAARAIGLHTSASRYDLAALLCRGGYDSHGNDCAPVDLIGNTADDRRMPQPLYLEGQDDGSVICNVGGLYYGVHPFMGHWLSIVSRGRRLSRMHSLGPAVSARQKRKIAQIFDAITARLQLFADGRFPKASGVLQKYLVSTGQRLQQCLRVVFRLAASIDLAVFVFFYRLYRKSPRSVRAWANKKIRSLFVLLRPQVRNTIGPLFGPRGRFRLFSPITEAHAHHHFAEARYQSGVARIFGLRPAANRGNATGIVGKLAKERAAAIGEPVPQADEFGMPLRGRLSPQAEDVLRRLLSETDMAGLEP